VINLREKAKKQTRVASALAIARAGRLSDWVEVTTEVLRILKSGRNRQEILPDINESLVVELYSK